MILPYGKNAPQLEIGNTIAGMQIIDVSYDNENLFYYVKSTVSTTVDATDDDLKRYRFIRIEQTSQVPSAGSMGFNAVFSQDTQPTGFDTQWCIWYDTSTNYFRYKTNESTTYDFICTLPYAVTEGGLVRQVFNGFGFVGSLIWVDKDVTCSFTNGLKDDGTINNLVQTNETVKTQTINIGQTTSGVSRWLFVESDYHIQDINSYDTVDYLSSEPSIPQSSNFTFSSSDNNFYAWNSTQQKYQKTNAMFLGKITHEPSANIDSWDIITNSTNYINT